MCNYLQDVLCFLFCVHCHLYSSYIYVLTSGVVPGLVLFLISGLLSVAGGFIESSDN